MSQARPGVGLLQMLNMFKEVFGHLVEASTAHMHWHAVVSA